MKKLLKWIFYIFIGFMAIGYFASKNDSSNSASANTEAQEPASAPQKEVFNTTARQLFKAYEENEVATDEQMKGKLVAVKGVVQSIDKDFTDSIIVSLKTDNEFMPARMEMKDSEKTTAIALKKGKQITVICEKMSRVIGAPSGRKCLFSQ
ncbi:OB-fold putative lipoprotein [Buttiauxella sp. WJP83]|uniref:OB-fold protein n=1 Tax=Buttiauxella sp. WJP83 TaxID=2986951 RepID=UPI0022DE3B09|nr:hypothetical protein [Buttiauxella sp. WJP83]WBM69126.1 OB-fold putative lipoprotein [Buttiauxella sp. WJP83]